MRDDWQSGYVETNGLRLHYTRTGGEKPSIVLAHGITDAEPCWTPVAEALATEYDVIMVDARGHGRSDAPERGYGPAEQAQDLAGVITGLELNVPAVLGHSMGAATALVLAGAHPNLPGAILLEDPPAWWTDRTDSPGVSERQIAKRERAIGLKQKTREDLFAGQRLEQPGWSDAELAPWTDAKQQFSPNVLIKYDHDNGLSVDWQAVLVRITCPTLLIVSDPDRGGIVTSENAIALKALVPHLEIAHIPEAGHNIRRDQFARYMAVVCRFLSEHGVETAIGAG
jgi:N-formylmaleamate deformylase